MNFTSLFKYSFLFLLVFIISCRSVEKVIQQNFYKQKNIPEIENYENNDEIFMVNKNINKNFEKNFFLDKIRHPRNTHSKLKIIVIEDKIYTLNKNSELSVHDTNEGKLLKKNQFIEIIDNDNLVSNYFKNNHFILGYSSGKIIKVDLDGNKIWSFENNKIFNSNIYEFDDIIIIFYGDEIVGLNFENGKKLWSEKYEDLPIIQAKGAQLVNFFNDIFFVLPNGRFGSLDLNLGTKNNIQLVDLELQNSINNANDKIYLFKNFLVYLDEGEFLYTYDLLTNEYLLYNFKINSSASNYFFNNALIIKNENFLEAINFLNGNTFWLIDSELNKKSEIMSVNNINENLIVFLNNGKGVIIDKDNITKEIDLKINKIKSFYLLNNKIVTILENGKIVIF